MNETSISLDLETTGLSPESDEIIEVAAVKFEGGQVIATFHSRVNPGRPLPYRIQALCGITQAEVDAAPLFSAVAPDLLSFLGPHPIVGHNVSFDLGFLSLRGIKPAGPVYDTYELSRILLPRLQDYNLSSVARHLALSPFSQHRALADALAAKDTFLALLDRASRLDLSIIEEMVRLSSKEEWRLGRLFQEIERAKIKATFSEGAKPKLPTRNFEHIEPLVPTSEKTPLDLNKLTSFFEGGGPLAKAFPNYEHRPEQLRMVQAVAQALNQSEHLIVEAGPGTGKSLAYLLPLIFFTAENNAQAVISTNTINLQEQLMGKDIPGLIGALGVELRAVQVKGRSNYLCLQRWSALKLGEGLSHDEIRFLLRLQVWLGSSQTGDRAELNLTRDEAMLWSKICAQVDDCLGGHCPYQQRGACFLYQARRAAESAHLIVVNHALLLSDMVANSKVLPEYSHLVIDEAHHLEEEATRQLGFQVSERDLADYLNQISQQMGRRESGLLARVRGVMTASNMASSRRKQLAELAEALQQQVARARSRLSRFFAALRDLVRYHAEDQGEHDRHLRLNATIRAQTEWSRIELSGENLNLVLEEIANGLDTLHVGLEDLPSAGDGAHDSLMLELSSLLYRGEELCRQLNSIISNPERDSIYWVSWGGLNEMVRLCAAPLHVGELLARLLFRDKDCVILSSATLSTEGTFEYIRGQLGLKDFNELLLGTFFDYLHSTLIYIAHDIPEPGKPGYQPTVEQTLIELCRAAQGRTLILFTSHAALQATQSAIQSPLEEEGILVLGQGIDGSPKQLLSAFKANPRAVLLGTASFWEGIDITGPALSVLVIARLPFSVPTDPVFTARSEMVDNPFNQYAVPQAALRFKQGFGRLIRSRGDRGVVAVLDSRLHGKQYGTAFLDSLPQCTLTKGSWRDLPAAVANWLETG